MQKFEACLRPSKTTYPGGRGAFQIPITQTPCVGPLCFTICATAVHCYDKLLMLTADMRGLTIILRPGFSVRSGLI